MTAVLLTPLTGQFFDNNGNPLSGGLVYSYLAGTSTPQATYTDASGSTPAANPRVLDSAGRADIWGSGTYKFIIKDSLLNTLDTIDNVTAIFGSGDMTKAIYDVANISQQVVGTTATQTLLNKTLSSPIINSSSGAETVLFQNTTAGVEAHIRVDATQTSSGSAVQISNSGLGGQISLRFQGSSSADGSLSVYTGQASGGGSTGGTQSLLIGVSSVLVPAPIGLGYGTGAGGVVTQLTSKTTSVTLNKPVGQITTSNSNMGANAIQSFTLVNSLITTSDVLPISFVAGSGTPAVYLLWSTVGSGSAVINIWNISGGALAETLKINFTVIKGATS